MKDISQLQLHNLWLMYCKQFLYSFDTSSTFNKFDRVANNVLKTKKLKTVPVFPNWSSRPNPDGQRNRK